MKGAAYEHYQIKCRRCGLLVSVVSVDSPDLAPDMSNAALMHREPACDKFLSLDVDVFLLWNRTGSETEVLQ